MFPVAERSNASEYLAVPEIAELTHISEAFWWKQLRLKKIPYVKLGAAVRVRRSSLDDWLLAREVAHE
jgi:excisionase family DNA binding protein